MEKDNLIKLYQNWANEEVNRIRPLPQSGSNRLYFRLSSNSKSAIGVFNADRKENLAFIEFSKHFKKYGLNVPEIFAEDLLNDIYLQEDLGDQNLFQFLSSKKTNNNGEFSDDIIHYYKKVLEELPKFQILASNDLDYSICYPRSDFDEQSMMWDLNYFKYYFIKLAGIGFDELLKAEKDYFLYRDFQSRNIMVKDDEVYFIDYQGGRRGALQYDLASLLFDAKADLPQNLRDELLDYYLDQLEKYIDFDREEFKRFYSLFVLIRIMQAMGAFGFRGFYERKTHFLASIPYAMQNLDFVLNNYKLPIYLPTLFPLLSDISKSEKLLQISESANVLKISLNSFSFRRGIPVDESGNGGGFVFDCRALPNPGRLDKYKKLTGKDLSVIEFLNNKSEVKEFLTTTEKLISQSVENYIERGFENLMINFGCTGGQHRSVYCVEEIAKFLRNKYNVKIIARHREQESEN
jgi:aminoglycoside/choline kinase family phosphotransferase